MDPVIPLVSVIAVESLLFTVVVAVLLARYYKLSRLLKSYHEFMLLVRIRALFKGNIASSNASLLSTEGVESHDRRQAVVLNNKISIVPDDLRIRFNQLDMGEVLGQGAFGRVFRAVLNDSTADGAQSMVAVKTVQDTGDPGRIIKFLEEGLLMKNFNHPNILGLLGLTFDPNGQPLIVLPFMANGDLKSYLVKQKQELPHTQLVMLAYHVALGMEYLAGQKFVHRDLAARNCMVDDELMAKIADFGLSRELDETDYYTSGDKKAKLPVKWMAPESMDRSVYNTKTDVWSYGILLWELFSRGCVPYPNIRNRDIYYYLKQGKRMDPPRFCPTKISEIMQQCWRDSPKKRCSFRQIVGELEVLVRSFDQAGEGQGGPRHGVGWYKSRQTPISGF